MSISSVGEAFIHRMASVVTEAAHAVREGIFGPWKVIQQKPSLNKVIYVCVIDHDEIAIGNVSAGKPKMLSLKELWAIEWDPKRAGRQVDPKALRLVTSSFRMGNLESARGGFAKSYDPDWE